MHNKNREWIVLFHEDFEAEFVELTEAVQDELLAHARLLKIFGPQLGRPRIDTLNNSRHSNMKELRFDINDGVWRMAFAFDPKRQAVILIAGNKSGKGQKRFYQRFIKKADARFDNWLKQLKEK